MGNFKIVTDSTADLPEEYLTEHQLGRMNLGYIIDGVTYGQGREMDWREFYALMRGGKMPTTSQVNPEEAKINLEEYYNESKQILCLAFSSALSGTLNSIRLAAAEVMEEHPDCKIIVIDTLAASLGEGLLVRKALELRAQGKSMEETAEWVTNHLLHVAHVFTVDDLHHLQRGGRLSKTAAILGTIVSIKPQLCVNDEGRLIPIGKVRGRKKSLSALVDFMEAKMGSFREENDMVFISHGDALEDAEFVRDLVRERLGIQEFMISHISPTVGAHAGPGTIALFFLGEART
ncbi:MAG: DegV family protein [Clostridium sp.]|nr:DegV family protein [Clostridium sp.]